MSQRLAGIEWMRGLSAFGVICIHSGLTTHNHTTPEAGRLRDCFTFAVPFFLVASFFFAIRTELRGPVPWREWLRRHAVRLLLPFLFWSAVYLALHTAKLILRHQTGEIGALFADPMLLLFGGGTSLALYFIPLLFIGLALIHALAGAWKRLPSWALLLGFVAGLPLSELFGQRGFSGGNFAMIVFQEAARCLPLIFAAALLERHLTVGTRHIALFITAGFCLLIVAQLLPLPGSLVDAALGIGSFLLGWGLPGPAQWASLMGLFSFGVYLVHQIFLELLQLLLPAGLSLGILGTLAVTVLVFAASMLTVGAASRGCPWTQRIFGLKPASS